MAEGILNKIANRWNWNNKQRGIVNLIFDIIFLAVFIFILLEVSKCVCVEGTRLQVEFDDCFNDCMIDLNNRNFCVNKCLFVNSTESNITLPFTSLPQS